MEGPRTAARERNPRQDRAHAPAPDHARLLTPAPTRRRSGGDRALSERRGVSGASAERGEFQGLCPHGARGQEKREPAFCRRELIKH